MKLKVVAECTHEAGFLPLLRAQLAKAGIPLCLDVNSTAKYQNGMRTLGQHVANLRRWTEKHQDAEYLIFTDAWDVLFFGTAEEVIAKIPETGVLMAAERNCFPDSHLAPQFKGETPWKFVNGGLLAGKTTEIAKWLDYVEACPSYQPGMIDQQWLNYRLLNEWVNVIYEPLIRIDRNTELFYCMYLDEGEMQPRGGKPFNALTGNSPNFIHFNGKHDASKFLKQIGANRNGGVLFARPVYREIQCAPHLKSLADTMQLASDHGYGVAMCKHLGGAYIQHSRNWLVKQFMDSTCEVLFFVDDDLSWNPEDALDVLETPGEVIAGVYPRKTEPLDFPVVIHADEEGLPIQRRDGCIWASHVPAGFLAIRRSAIEKLRSAYPELHYSDLDEKGQIQGGYFDMFPQGVHKGRWWGEDFAFSRLWNEIGGKIWVVPDITFTHYGGPKGSYTANYHEYLLGCPGGSKDQSKKEMALAAR